MPDFLNDLKAKALDVWRRAPTVVVVSGIGLLLLCSTCCLCGGCLGGFLGGGGTDSPESSDGDTTVRSESTEAKSAEAAKEHLIETARRMEGTFVTVIVDYIEAVESGDWTWGMADDAFLYKDWTPETKQAYREWRAAKIAEDE